VGGFVAGAIIGGLAEAAIARSNSPTVIVNSPGIVPPGTIVYDMPYGCTPTVVNGITYEFCGGTYYLPEFQGTSVVYEAVTQPY